MPICLDIECGMCSAVVLIGKTNAMNEKHVVALEAVDQYHENTNRLIRSIANK